MKCGFIIFLWLFSLIACSSARSGVDDGIAALGRGDYAHAFAEFQALAEENDDYGEYNLGVMYENGYGREKDYAVAIDWYMKGIAKGFSPAFYSVGNMYRLGKGVAKDEQTGRGLLLMSAEMGYAPAQYSLGIDAQEGGDYAAAMKWFQAAAAQRYSRAMGAIAALYYQGYGVTKNVGSAYMWYTLRLMHGMQDQREFRLTTAMREELRKMMTPEEVIKAAAQARQWLLEVQTPTEIIAANRLASSWVSGQQSGLESSPELSFLDYMAFGGASIVYTFETGRAEGSYTVFLDRKPSLPDSAIVEVWFEDPLRPYEPWKVSRPLSSEDREIVVQSPTSWGFQCGQYKITTMIFNDEAKEEMLGLLSVVIPSRVDTSMVKTNAELLMHMKERGSVCPAKRVGNSF